MGEYLQVSLRKRGDTVRAFLVGELDLAARSEVVDRLSQADGSRVIVDLSELNFVDAAGIQALLSAKRAIRRSGASFEIRGAKGVVRRVFDLCGLGDELTD